MLTDRRALIDHQALIQDGVDDVGEAAGRGAVEVAVGRWMRR